VSFIGGIVSLDDKPLSPTMTGLSIDTLPHGGHVSRYQDAYASLFQIDFGIFEEPGAFHDSSGATFLAGHPLLPGDELGASLDQCRGARRLHEAGPQNLGGLASQSAGTWAGACYDNRARVLTLCSDRVGVRPLYWWTDGHIAVFSSNRKLLEAHPLIPLKLDLGGVLEGAALGYIFGDRTQYLGIHRMLEAELVGFTRGGIERSHYYFWADLPERSAAPPSRASEALEAMRTAVARRNGRRREAIVLLSGGMDSRVVTAALHELGVAIHSFNFSIPGTYDEVFSRKFARLIGAQHHHGQPVRGRGPGWVHKGGKAWEGRLTVAGTPMERAYPIWTGDFGGGIPSAIITPMREGRTGDAIGEFMKSHRVVSPHDVVPEARQWFATAIHDSAAAELARHESNDPARQFILFLVANAKRRNMDTFYEHILDHRTELWTPFIDANFLEATFSVPVDEAVGHKFYDRWFNLLPPFVRGVPWQTYPGHVPCPVPVPPNLIAQWDREYRAARKKLKRHAPLVGYRTLIHHFPNGVFLRRRFIARALLHYSSLRSSFNALDILTYFSQYWRTAKEHPLPWK
jgi:asparagine synthase (glutamine-hydrolysing)